MKTNAELNMQMLEVFGNFEQICNQIYSSHHGVSNYIDDMVSKNDYFTRKIPNWDEDLKRLKYVRHTRNKLSHGEVPFNANWTKEEDVQFVLDFRDRLLNANDPLAVYRRATTPKSRNQANNVDTDMRADLNSFDKDKRKGRPKIGCFTHVAIIFGVAALIVGIICLL